MRGIARLDRVSSRAVIRVHDLGLLPYRDAWQRQEAEHARIADHPDSPESLLLVEHPPVITFGRRPGVESHLLADPEALDHRGVQVVPSDRGGDITFHGPGQLVAYPIIRLAAHHFSVGGYMHALEDAVIATLADLGCPNARNDPAAVGVWVPYQNSLAKICAMGVRVRRGVTMHGLALNVTTDLSFFNLIVPCGLPGRAVTSLTQILGPSTPPMLQVKDALARQLIERFDTHTATPQQPTPPRVQ